MARCMPGPRDGAVAAPGKLKIIRQTALAAAVASLFFAPGIHETEAAFTTNFTGTAVTGVTYTTGGWVDYTCNMSYTVKTGVATGSCSGGFFNGHEDNTPYFQALFTDTATSKSYFHVIIGDKNFKGQAHSEMVAEYIIEATSNARDASARTTSGYTDDSTDTNVAWNMNHPHNADSDIRNGSGAADPTRVIMNQVLYNDDATVNTQFLKGIQGGTVSFNKTTGLMTLTGGSTVFDSKPIITQFANDGGMLNQFTIDMRHKSYSDKTQMSDAEANGPNGKITNITNLQGGGAFGTPAADQGDYDTTDATFTAHYVNNSNPDYTAGAFTYTAGSGTNKDLGGGGTYDYDIAATSFVESGFVPWNLDWTDFCEPTINPDWVSGSAATIGGPKACTDTGNTRQGRGRRGW